MRNHIYKEFIATFCINATSCMHLKILYKCYFERFIQYLYYIKTLEIVNTISHNYYFEMKHAIKKHGPILFRTFMFLLDLGIINNHITEKVNYFKKGPMIILKRLHLTTCPILPLLYKNSVYFDEMPVMIYVGEFINYHLTSINEQRT